MCFSCYRKLSIFVILINRLKSLRQNRPRSLDSDLLILPLPNGNDDEKSQSRSRSGSIPTNTGNLPLPVNPVLPIYANSTPDKSHCNGSVCDSNRFLKRTSTTATCAVQPRLLEHLSDTSTSPER